MKGIFFVAPLTSGDTPLFAKIQPLDTLKATVRVTFGKPQRNGRFDWPLEELINTLEAQRRGVQMPALQGFGYTKDRLEDDYIRQIPGISKEKFNEVYLASKHEHVGRKQRREVFLNGKLITG
ncbi:hypothetical protein [Pseudomonas sp. LT1P18]|uniref:hypothetical protein n=1 Tax=Pseudomonas arabinosi TaxID=3398357 RepID=UPI0039F0406B